MRRLALGVFLLCTVSMLSGQPSITVTSSRSIALQPDEAVFSVLVTSGINTALDDVVAALQGSGVTASNLVSVSTYTSQQRPQLQWAFTLPVPFSRIKDTTASLTALQKTLASGFSLAFTTQGSRVSPQSQALQECPISDLIADARAQAQRVATGAGGSVGPILALSDGGLDRQVPVPTTAIRIGDFYSGIAYSGVFLVPPATIAPPLTCTVMVKFALINSQ